MESPISEETIQRVYRAGTVYHIVQGIMWNWEMIEKILNDFMLSGSPLLQKKLHRVCRAGKFTKLLEIFRKWEMSGKIEIM
jgi:hypothetical protein